MTRVTIERLGERGWIPEGSSLCFAKVVNRKLRQAGSRNSLRGLYGLVEDDPKASHPYYDLIVNDQVKQRVEEATTPRAES